MPFQVKTETRPAARVNGTVYILEETAGRARAEIWPANGFNCYHWRITREGTVYDLLYTDPAFFQGGKPTRTGIPILFPFPNRIRAGHFRWDGRDYRLPLDDPAGKNAIHGFACRHPWRVTAKGADAGSAWITGEFRGSLEAPESGTLWPADYLIRVTVRLTENSLRLEAMVENPDRVPLPFGLGYHPYFRIPAQEGKSPGDYLAQADAGQFWKLEESLPTGEILSVEGKHNLRQPRPFSSLHLDDVWHAGQGPVGPEKPKELPALIHRASLFQNQAELLRLDTAPCFGELVVFTPPHRQAICFEPYTCATDAINLQARGMAAGLRVLQPKEQWQGDVVLTVAGVRE